MLEIGRARALDRGILYGIEWLGADAERLPFAERSFDLYTIAFGLRNVTHIEAALAEARRVLKPGGRFMCLEFTPEVTPLLQPLYDLYSFHVVPLLGQIVTGDRDAYTYLVESIRGFPRQGELARNDRGSRTRAGQIPQSDRGHRRAPLGLAPLKAVRPGFGLPRSPRNLARLAAIGLILARHDALFPFAGVPVVAFYLRVARLFTRRRGPPPARPGQRLAAALDEMGPSFIKLGQLLSTRADLFGEEIAADLASLQDRLPPFPGAQARAAIEAEFGRPLETLFASFDETAIAAASIAQVHFAAPPTAARSRSRCCGRDRRRPSPATSTCSCGSPAGSSGFIRRCGG